MSDIYKILIADNNKTDTNQLSDILKQEDYAITIVRNDSKLIDHIINSPPDIIILDIDLPDKGGFEICKILKKKRNCYIPIVFISSKNTKLSNLEAFNAGGCGFIKKPFKAEEVNSKVKKYLKVLKYKIQTDNSDLELYNRFRDITENIADWVWETDTKGHFTYLSDKVFEILGYTPDELIGKTPFFTMTEEEVKKYKKKLFNENESLLDSENWNLHKNGSRVCLLTNSIPIYENGNLSGYRGINRNITSRKITEDKIRKNEEKFRELIESLADGVMILDDNHNILMINKKCEEIFGFEREELLGKSIELLIPLENKEIRNTKTNEILLEKKAQNKDGKMFPVEITLGPVKTDEGIFTSVSIRDISKRKAVEEQLEINNDRLRLATQIGKIGIWDWDIVNDILIWDDSMYKLCGVEKKNKKLKLKDWKELLHPSDAEEAITDFETALNDRTELDTEYRIITTYDGIKYLHSSAATTYDSDNIPVRMVGVNIDITRIKNAEFSTRQSEKRLKEAQTLANIGNWELNHEKKTLYWSDQIYSMFEIDQKEEELSYEEYTGYIHNEDRLRVMNKYETHLSDKKAYDIEYRVVTGKNRLIHVHENCKTKYNSKGKPLKSMGTIQDITEKKIIEKKILQLNEELEERVIKRTKELKDEKYYIDYATNSLPGIFYTFDRDGYIERCNKNYLNLIGKNDEKMKKTKIIDTIAETDRRRVKKAFADAFDDGVLSIEGNLISHSGDYIPYFLTGSMIKINEKEYIVGVGFDITEQKQSEIELKRLSQAVEQSPASVIITDTIGRIIYVNKQFSNVTGYGLYEVIGKSPSIIKSGKFTKSDYKIIWDTILAGKTWKGEFLNKKKNGELFWEYASISPILDQEKNIKSFLAVKEDITDRKEREKELKNKATRLDKHSRFLLQLTRGADLTDTTLDKAYEIITKYAARGLDIPRSSIWLYENDATSLKCICLYDYDRKQDVKDLYFSSSDHPKYFEILTKNFPIIANDALNDKRTSEFRDDYLEKENICSVLNMPIWLRGKVIGVISNETRGEIKEWKSDEESYIRSLADFISLAIEADDRKKAQEAAEAATRAKSDFIANMSHEIRTPMNAVIGLTHLLSRTPLTKKQEDYVKKIDNSSKNLLRIINDILDFSKIEAGKLEIEHVDFDLNEVMDNILNIINIRAQSKGIELILDVDSNVPRSLNGDPLRIGQILLNLANNAVKFTDEGEILIKCEIETITTHDVVLKFSVIDTGIGLTEEQTKKLFKSFSQADTSTTRKYGGTGLGLSISKKLTEMMHGHIEVKSKYDRGSTFSFTVKCRILKRRITGKIKIPKEIQNLRVLIVDDNDSAREVLTNFLTDYELDVVSVTSGYEAISTFLMANGKNNNPFDLILMDYKMPKLNGVETVKEIRKLKKLKQPNIILITSYGREDIINEAESVGIESFLLKPVTQSTLYDTIISIYCDEKTGKKERETKDKEDEGILNHDLRILLVEDNEINQQIALEIMREEDIEMDLAVNGLEAIKRIELKSYDIILMDLQMPVMDGITATKKIREKIPEEKLPIIAMTADAMTGVEKKVLEAGMNDYITKPINTQTLFKTINKWINTSYSHSKSKVNESFPEIENLDCKEGIKRLNGNIEAYLRVIKKFRDNNLNTGTKLKELFTSKNYNQCKSSIHTLKGIAGNISAVKLYHACIKTEKVLNKNNYEAVEELLKTLINELDSTISGITKYEEKNIMNNSNKNSLIPKKKLKAEDIELMKKYLNSNNMECKEFIEKLIETVSNIDTVNSLKTILNKVDNYDFDDALKIVEKLNY